MAMYNMSTPLQFCSTYTDPCTRCFFGAGTTYVEFPYNVTQTVTVTIIPYVTGLPDGTNSTYSYSTSSGTEVIASPTDSSGPPIFTDDSSLTWELNGVTLTYPTTYVSFYNFSGIGAPQTAPVYGSNATATCASLSDVTRITLPATTEPSSFFLAPTSGTEPPELDPDVLPSALLDYVQGLSTVVEQMNGNTLSTCAPTTTPSPTKTTCLTVTASTKSTCTTYTTDYGSATSTCATEIYTNTETVTLFPTALSTSVGAPPVIKTPAAALNRQTGQDVFKPYTPPAAGESSPPISPDQESPTPPAQSQTLPNPPPESSPPPETTPPIPDATEPSVPPPDTAPSTPDNTQPAPIPGSSEPFIPPPDSTPSTPDNTQPFAPPPDSTPDTTQPYSPPPESTTGMGSYILSGIQPAESSTVTYVGPNGTSVSIVPYTGAATRPVAVDFGSYFGFVVAMLLGL